MKLSKKHPALFVLDLATKFGLPVEMGSLSEFRSGKIYIAILPSTMLYHPFKSGNIFGRLLAHELGHFLVASKTRRYKNDYGIPVKRYSKNHAYWDIDEDKANCIEFEIINHFKFYKVQDKYTPKFSTTLKWWNKERQQSVRNLLKRSYLFKSHFGCMKDLIETI